MIQSVDNSSTPASSASKPSSTGSTGGASFAATLASAQSSGGVETDLKPPKGETWGPVPGHTDYADILSGPRNGFYVSLTGPRKGQAFEIVHKQGKTFHVYGEGAHKKWIAVPPNPADLKPPKGETWDAVANHTDYKKIAGGKRANEYVNLSGNERTGQAFKIAHHDGKTWHVYGNGREVAVGGHRRPQAPPTGNPSLPG
ncbi:MAG TPA: hypothetical protein VF032_04400 [Thermoleophilaceae bacterium]